MSKNFVVFYEAILPHCLKLFDNCKDLLISRGKFLTGMRSEEGEAYDFETVQKAEGPVEVWMKTVDEEMKVTLWH